MANRMLEEDPPRYTRASDPGEARLRGKDAPSSWLLCTDTDVCDAFVGVQFKYMNAYQRCLLSALFQFRNNIKNTFVFMTLLRPYMCRDWRQFCRLILTSVSQSDTTAGRSWRLLRGHQITWTDHFRSKEPLAAADQSRCWCM